MKRRIVSIVLVAPIVVAAIVFTLLISPAGSKFAAYIATRFTPNLTIEGAKGGLIDTISFDSIQWKNESLSISIEDISLDITWPNLREPHLFINDLLIENVAIAQMGESSEDAQPEEPTEPLSLPITLSLVAPKISHIALDLPRFGIQLDKLSIDNASIKDDLNITQINLGKLTINEKSLTHAVQLPDIPTSYALSYTPPVLPEVSTPLPIAVYGVNLNDIVYLSKLEGEQRFSVSLETLEFAQNTIALKSLGIEHDKGQLAGDIDAELKNEFMSQVSLDANWQWLEQTQSARVFLQGPLSNLTINTTLSGAFDGELTAQTNFLDAKLPISLDAKWQQQGIAQQSDTPVAIAPGVLSLNGEMGDYSLISNGDITLPSIGNVALDIDVSLKTKYVYVNRVNAGLLGGEVINTGSLYLDESLFWDGLTQLNNINAKTFSEYAPQTISGSFSSLFQLSDKGIDAKLSEINFSGELNNHPMIATGNLVYSSVSDLAVGSLNLVQEENIVSLSAQLFNKRHLNATSSLNLPHLAHLYPNVEGRLRGDIQASGPWENPTIKAEINIVDMDVSEALVSTSADLGSIDGSVIFEGTYEDHKLTTDIALKDYSVQAIAQGALLNGDWEGQVSESEIDILGSHWALVAPFDVSLKTAAQAFDVTSHCWSNVNSGELCADQLGYSSSTLLWKLHGSQLPAGQWLYSAAPMHFGEPANTLLSFSSDGEFTDLDTMTAAFSTSLSPAKWHLGEQGIVELTINEFKTESRFSSGLLNTSISLSTQNAGRVNLELAADPFDMEYPIEGYAEIEDLNVAPLKPLFNSFRIFTGTLNGEMTVTGQASAPSIAGQLAISNGGIAIQDAPLTLENWEQQIRLENQRAELEGQFVLGGGQGELNGVIDWSDNPLANLSLKGEAFEVLQPNMTLRLSPDITIVSDINRTDISGRLDIPFAQIEIDTLPESAVSPSNDVYLRGETKEPSPLDTIFANVSVGVDPSKSSSVSINAFGLTGHLHGLIDIKTQPALVAYGDLQVLNGEYKAYGQQLLINKGEVQFNGPIESPSLLIEAIRDPEKTDNNVVAGVRIDGNASAPYIELFSTPSMDQQNVLSYLLTGQGPDGTSSDPNYAALLLGFGLSNTKGVTSQIGDTLGIDSLQLGTNESMLSVTGQINDRLSVQYNVDVGLSNDDSNNAIRRRQVPPDLALKYSLYPQLFLEAVQNTIEEQTEFAVDIYYEFFRHEDPAADSEEN
ncbi:translocation/assembly module TamB domain-containing protein [Alteromonas sp. KUL49]|uniref:translocation/assembly module TamB domain-containing protein n=1 Tax=Alteromonas sp. KUL49 TaxID=2480798 RepID=UPI00102EF42E|nr:translocation/assembly module TamB domain-containing protein [Alteromonas sp. KUL49]TAP42137.1 DUF490 domain-containing protein [Alteromonas sp. KUL49]GEA09722.1 translocation and assembly module TamB [Alteromonas sp. KUL49]